MKQRKIWMCTLLGVLFNSIFGCQAAEMAWKKDTADTSRIQSAKIHAVTAHIVNLYEDRQQGKADYVVWDKEGKEITDRFEKDMQRYIQKTDREGIAEYFLNEVSAIEKTTEEWSVNRTGDLAKTWKKEVIQAGVFDPVNPDAHAPMPVTVTFECELTGTIYYDPNTMKITAASGPFQLGAVRRTDLSGTSGVVEYQYHTPSTRVVISPDRLSADFYFSMHITGDLSGHDRSYDFGYLGGSEPVYTATVA